MKSTTVNHNTVTSSTGPATGGGIYNAGAMSVENSSVRKNKASAPIVLGFFPRMMAPYDGTLRVQVTVIVADDDHGFVGVRQSAERPTEGPAWTGVHVWGFQKGNIGPIRELLQRRLLRVLIRPVSVVRRRERLRANRGSVVARCSATRRGLRDRASHGGVAQWSFA